MTMCPLPIVLTRRWKTTGLQITALAAVAALLVACGPESARPPAAVTTPDPSPVPEARIRIVENVEYAPGSVTSVVGPSRGDGMPAVVLLHGIGQSAKTLYPLASALASEGVVVFVPEWGAPSPVASDVGTVTAAWARAADAIAFARRHGSGYGASGERVVVVGHSWGASAAAGLLLAGPDLASANGDRGLARPDAAVALDGPMDTRVLVPAAVYAADRATWDRMNPTHLLAAARLPGAEFTLLIGDTWPESDATNRTFAEEVNARGGAATVRGLNKLHMEMAQPIEPIVDAIVAAAGGSGR